jgi:hypothetical protein
MSMTTNDLTKTIEKYLFVHEGQSVPIEGEIAADPDLLKRLVSTWAPAARTGTLEYSEPDEHGIVTITLLTRAQPKGIQVVAADPVTALLKAEAGENPVIVLYRRLNELYAEAREPAEIFVTQGEIEHVLETGRKENTLLEKICKRLENVSPTEAP